MKMYEYALAPIRDKNGHVTHAISTARDVTEKAAMIETLMLRDRAITAANGGIVIADPNQPDCPIIYANPSFERMTGYSQSEIIGQNCRFLQGADTRHEEVAKLRDAIRAERACTVILKNYRKDGGLFWNELTLTPVHDPNGRLVHFLGVQSDITERVRVQEALAVALQREKRIATTLQRSLLLTPPETFPGLHVATLYAPAWDEALIGGDFYDAIPLDNGRVALVVGDASGKGIDAAARTIEVKFALRVYLREDPDPARALSRLNDFVCDSQRFEETVTDMAWPFISLTLCVVDPGNHTVAFASAGAEMPLFVCEGDAQAGGIAEDAGLPLGISPRQEYIATVRAFPPGDTLVLTTDGVTEARQKGDLFGYERMAETACDALQSEEKNGVEWSPETLKGVAKRVIEAAAAFANGKLTDDVCFLVARATA